MNREQENTVEELVREVDAIRAIKLADKAEEARRITEIEAKIRVITGGPRHHAGRGVIQATDFGV